MNRSDVRRALLAERITLETGWIEAAGDVERVAIGDRFVPAEVTAHLEGKDQPSLDLTIAVVDGVPQCRQLRLTASDGGREVRTLDLRAVRLAELVEDLLGLFAYRLDGDTVVRVGSLAGHPEPESVAAVHEARKGKGARVLTDDFLVGVADTYRTHFEKAPIQAVAKAYGVGERTARSWVSKSRAAGHLPATKRGRKAI